MKKTTDTIFLTVCAVFVLSLGVFIIVSPHKSFSPEENRVLAAPPVLSFSSFMSGKHFSDTSDFYSDHFPLRQILIKGKAICELCFGKRQNNGVIFTQDGKQTDTCRYDNTVLLDKNLSAISRFCSAQSARCVLVPRSIDICGNESEESLRILAKVADTVDEPTLISVLDRNDYYKTDHHLNSEGAYKVYRQIISEFDIVPYEKTDFRIETVSDSFLGSTYSKSGLLKTSYDSISLYRYDNDSRISVNCKDTGCSQSAIYSMEKLEEKDKYTVFLGGNHGILTVTDKSESRPTLLLIKDSFANAVIPLLARHFDITVIDPRYCAEPLSQITNDRQFDHTVILCGIDTLATGSAFARALN